MCCRICSSKCLAEAACARRPGGPASHGVLNRRAEAMFGRIRTSPSPRISLVPAGHKGSTASLWMPRQKRVPLQVRASLQGPSCRNVWPVRTLPEAQLVQSTSCSGDRRLLAGVFACLYLSRLWPHAANLFSKLAQMNWRHNLVESEPTLAGFCRSYANIGGTPGDSDSNRIEVRQMSAEYDRSLPNFGPILPGSADFGRSRRHVCQAWPGCDRSGGEFDRSWPMSTKIGAISTGVGPRSICALELLP